MLESLWRTFQDGGWMMFIVLALGLVAVAAAARFARRGEHQLLGFLKAMILTLASAGLLGFITGMQMVLRAAFRVESGTPLGNMTSSTQVLFRGGREALSCVSTSLLFITLVLLLISVGLRRFPQPNASSLI